ncbi:DUF4334 domain-containing protein [Rhodococcus sp. ABRD24]|uniref:DUF4334 domain-containing protein n=1 Tax=Rhodococcus sp. ABRD24 TaxID=2507582 RepID=UPI00103965B6|nr:DUF4334 domain-containing protein [Rhodococcus sp. ABRD24]QBJ96932.1 DUF4334 domain-containing protein [Rhodococcus sp. ABRD24]
MTVYDEVAALRARGDRIDPREFDALWDRLAPCRPADLIGYRWRGFAFDTGHRTGSLLDRARWYGKAFTSETDVQPLLCRSKSGQLFSDVGTGHGEASLWEVAFRGEVTATMVYDGLPIFDHFKKVDADTVIGVMNGKSNLVFDAGEHFWFGLERDAALPDLVTNDPAEPAR